MIRTVKSKTGKIIKLSEAGNYTYVTIDNILNLLPFNLKGTIKFLKRINMI